MDLEFQKEVTRALNAVNQDPEWVRYFDFDHDGSLDPLESSILRAIVSREVTLADGAPKEWMTARASEIVRDRYRVLGHLSSGGQADTELAYDHERNGPAVLKRIRLGEVEEWKSLELFQRESSVLQSLQHDRIPTFLESFPIGDPPHTFCIVQEFISGAPASQRLEDGGIYEVEQVIALLHQLFSILEYIHGHTPPVVHRDIKPANLILSAEKVFLIDFGAASQKAQTPEGGSTVVGTHGYMPLEQYMGVVTPATDLYAVGATALHMVTGVAPGKMPFSHGAVQFEPYLDANSELRPLIRALLQPVAEDRPTSVSEARKILLEGERTDAIVSAHKTHALVARETPWLVSSQRGNMTVHYIEGTSPFRVTESMLEVAVRNQRNIDYFLVATIALMFIIIFSYAFSFWVGLIGTLTLIGVAVGRPSSTFVHVEPEHVTWGRHRVTLDRVVGCRAKRAMVILKLKDRDVELTAPCKTHEQATFVAEHVNDKIQSLKTLQAERSAKSASTDSRPKTT